MSMTVNQWLRTEKKTQAWLAEELELSEATMSRLCKGTVRVYDATAARIVALSAGAVDPLTFLPTAAALWREFHAPESDPPPAAAPESNALTNGGEL